MIRPAVMKRAALLVAWRRRCRMPVEGMVRLRERMTKAMWAEVESAMIRLVSVWATATAELRSVVSRAALRLSRMAEGEVVVSGANLRRRMAPATIIVAAWRRAETGRREEIELLGLRSQREGGRKEEYFEGKRREGFKRGG